MASNVKLVGSVGIKVRPVTDGFKRDAENQVKEKLADADAKFPVEAELTEESARRLKTDSKKAVEEADKEAGDVEIEMVLDKRGFDRAIARVEEKLREVENGTTKIKIKPDEDYLKELKQDLKDLREGSPIKLKYTDDPEGRKAAAAKIDEFIREMSQKEIDLSFDKDSLEKEKRDLLKGLGRDPLKAKTVITYDRDRNSLEAALKKVDDRLKQMKAVKVPIDWDDRADVEKWQKELQKRLTKYPLKIKVRDDQDSWAALINDLEKRRRELEKKVTFVVKPDEAKSAAGMQRAIERARAQAKLSPIDVDIEYNNDVDSVDRAIQALRDRLRAFDRVEIRATMNREEIEAQIKELEAERLTKTLHIEYDPNEKGLLAAKARIEAELGRRKKLTIDVGLSEAELMAEMAKLDAELRVLTGKKHVAGIKPRIEPLSEAAAALKLKYLSRDRVTNILVRARDLTAFTFAKLTGLRAATRWAQEFGRALGTLDRNLPIVAAITLGISQLSSGILSLGSNIFTLGASLAQIGYLGLLGPALIGGLAASMVVWIGVFKDLGAAINGDEKAFKKLTASGQAAVNRIRPLFQDLREGMSKNFWEGSSDALLRFTHDALPAFSQGFKDLGRTFGQGFGSVLDSFNAFARQGGITTQFGLLNTGIKLMNQGAARFWHALNTIGAVGAQVFPRLGSAFTRMANRFDDWAMRVASDGSLSTWITRGIEAFKNLARVFVNAGQVWGNVARAAEAAGGMTLKRLADGLQGLENITNDYRFQRNMQTIFEGAHEGMRLFLDGLGNMGPAFDKFSKTIKDTLIGAGMALSSALGWISDILASPGVGKGLGRFLSGLNNMFHALKPSASAIGDIIGNLGDVLGTVATDVGPLFAELFKQLSSVFGAAWSELKPFVSELTDMGKVVISDLGPTLTRLAHFIVPAVGKAFEAVAPKVEQASGFLNDFTQGLSRIPLNTAIKDIFGPIFGSNTKEGGQFWDNMLSITPEQKQSAVDGWHQLYGAIADGLKAGPDSMGIGQQWDQWIENFKKDVLHVGGDFGGAGGTFDTMNESQKALAAQAEITKGKLLELARIDDILRDSSSGASAQIDAMRRSLDLLRGPDPQTIAEAVGQQKSNLNTLVEQAKTLKPELEKVGAALFTNKGFLDVSSGNQAVMAMNDAFKKQADDIWWVGKTTYEAARAQGKSVSDAFAESKSKMDAAKGDMGTLAEAAGINADKIYGYLDRVFGNDWVLKAQFTGTTTQFEDAKKQAEALGLQFSEEEFMTWLLANPDPAKVTTDDVSAYIKSWADKRWEATLGALPGPAQEQLKKLTGLTEQQWVDHDWKAVMRAAENIPGLASVISQLWKAGPGTDRTAIIKALANVAAAEAELDRIASQQRTATIIAHVTTDGSARAVGGSWGMNLDGGIWRGNTKVFANGGFFEKHVAQIARPGVTARIWAEPETGGEAYIPYALHKRQRSTEILSRVASDFGYQLVRRYADGGTTAGSSTSYHAPVTIGQLITTDPDQAVRALQTKRRDAMAVHQIRPF